MYLVLIFRSNRDLEDIQIGGNNLVTTRPNILGEFPFRLSIVRSEGGRGVSKFYCLYIQGLIPGNFVDK
jgi:hypothetical protein